MRQCLIETLFVSLGMQLRIRDDIDQLGHIARYCRKKVRKKERKKERGNETELEKSASQVKESSEHSLQSIEMI